jgi:hypothetical protein
VDDGFGGGPGHKSVPPGLDLCDAGLDLYAALDQTGWGPGEFLGALDCLSRLRRRVTGLEAMAAAAAERRGAAQRSEGVDVATHLTQAQNVSGREAQAILEQGRQLRKFGLLGEACAKGELSVGQAKACADGLADFPADQAGDRALEEIQRDLVDKAKKMGAAQLGKEASRSVAKALEECGANPADVEDLGRRRAVCNRYIRFVPEGASVRFHGQMPAADGEALEGTLKAMARQARRQPGGIEPNPDGGKPRDAALMVDALTRLAELARREAASRGVKLRGGPHGRGAGDGAGSGLRAASAGHGDGLSADREAWPPGVGKSVGTAAAKAAKTAALRTLPQVSVVLDGAAFGVGVLSGVSLGAGVPMSSREAARVLCDSEVRRVVLGLASEPLDVGREHRVVTDAIRLALTLRDGGCSFPGCDVPPSNTHAHHIVPWWAGGTTDRDNLCLVCWAHHLVVEPDREPREGLLPGEAGWDDPNRWRMVIDPVDRHPRAVPPARVDPLRRPMLNGRIAAKLAARGLKGSRPGALGGSPRGRPPAPPPEGREQPPGPPPEGREQAPHFQGMLAVPGA